MAVSRVGGARSKIAGQVGSTIYQIRKNADGSYTQIVYAKGESVETTITPKLQAQRMCMAMVESLMRDIKDVANISFESGKNKSQSLNAFSSWNTYKVNNDCRDHWYSDNKFMFPTRHRSDVDIQDLGGPWIISSGSLTRNIFDEEVYDDRPRVNWLNVDSWDYCFHGVKFNCNIGVDTLEDFRKAHGMTVRDVWGFVAFRNWVDYVTTPDDPQEYYQHEYILAAMNAQLPSSSLLTQAAILDIFKFGNTLPLTILFARDGKSFAVGALVDTWGSSDVIYNQAAFSLSYYDGKKRISSSTYHNPEGGEEPWLLHANPSNVFGSWMGEPWVKPYPSPF